MKKLLFIGIIALLYTKNCQAQSNERQFYLSPALMVGYVFGGGFAFGLDVDMGLSRHYLNNSPVNYGISAATYWTYVTGYRNEGGEWHNHYTVNFMAEGQYFDFKAGLGSVHFYNGEHQCYTVGLNFDVSGTLPQRNIPYIGLRTFLYFPDTWMYYDDPYTTLYTKYKYTLGYSGLKQ